MVEVPVGDDNLVDSRAAAAFHRLLEVRDVIRVPLTGVEQDLPRPLPNEVGIRARESERAGILADHRKDARRETIEIGHLGHCLLSALEMRREPRHFM